MAAERLVVVVIHQLVCHRRRAGWGEATWGGYCRCGWRAEWFMVRVAVAVAFRRHVAVALLEEGARG